LFRLLLLAEEKGRNSSEKNCWLILGAEESDTEPIILDDEVDEVCQAFGRILVLLDEIFACMNTERGGVSNEVNTKLTNPLELARVKWNELNFSSAPKWHDLPPLLPPSS
jgi:hypothetical protein